MAFLFGLLLGSGGICVLLRYALADKLGPKVGDVAGLLVGLAREDEDSSGPQSN